MFQGQPGQVIFCLENWVYKNEINLTTPLISKSHNFWSIIMNGIFQKNLHTRKIQWVWLFSLRNLSARHLQLFFIFWKSALYTHVPDINTIQMCYCIATNWRQMTPTSLRRRPDSSPLCARPWAQTRHPETARTLLQPRIMRANSKHTLGANTCMLSIPVATTFPHFPPRETRDISQRPGARARHEVCFDALLGCVDQKHTTLSAGACIVWAWTFFAAAICVFESRPSGRDEYMGLLWRRTRLPVAVKCQLASAPSTEGWSFY